MLTETEHLRSLADILHRAADLAARPPTNLPAKSSDFRALIHNATAECTALAFYRNQAGWQQIAVLLDELAKRIVPAREWPRIAQLTTELRSKIAILANRGTH